MPKNSFFKKNWNSNILSWKMEIWNSWLWRVTLCSCSTYGLSCVTAMVASGIQFEQCFFLRDRVDDDRGKCTLTKQLLSRADSAHGPHLKLMKYCVWNFVFHNKKVRAYYFIFFSFTKRQTSSRKTSYFQCTLLPSHSKNSELFSVSHVNLRYESTQVLLKEAPA